MSHRDIESRIKEKLEKKMLQLQQKVAEIPDVAELNAEMARLEAEIAAVRMELGSSEDFLEQHERLTTRLEQLMAKKEYMGLRVELHTERQERLWEILEELQQDYERRKTVNNVPSTCSAQTMQEERRKVLEMLQNGKITVDDANRLLTVLGEQEGKLRTQRRPRWVRIRVTATDTGRTRVNVTLPIGLVKAGLRAGGSIAGIEGLDTKDLEALLNRGEVGHWVDIVDERDTERVEISVE